MVLSFIANSNLTGVYSVALQNNGFDRSIVYVFNLVSGVPQLIILPIPPSPSAGTWNYTNGRGLEIAFGLMPGSAPTAIFGAWQQDV